MLSHKIDPHQEAIISARQIDGLAEFWLNRPRAVLRYWEKVAREMRIGPATFWYGADLSFVEVLCLKSYVDLGIPIVLYAYEPIAHVPQGVVIKDANEIVPKEKIFKNLERNSYAPFADYFRYKLLQVTDFYWVDADVLALAPFPVEQDYLFAEQHNIVGNAVLSLPSESPVLAELIEACENPSSAMPWLSALKRREMAQLGDQFDVSHLPYKALGPTALNWLLKTRGMMSWAVPTPVLYPYLPRHMLKSGSRLLRLLPAESVAIHVYNSNFRGRLKNAGLEVPPRGSLLGVLCERHGVEPADFPIS